MTEDKRVATILCSVYEECLHELLRMLITEKLGYNILLASNTDQAIPHVPKADLVITDIRYGGYKLIGYVKQTRPELNVIAMTGTGHDPKELEGAVDILPKPFNETVLEAIVNKYVPEHLKPGKAQ